VLWCSQAQDSALQRTFRRCHFNHALVRCHWRLWSNIVLPDLWKRKYRPNALQCPANHYQHELNCHQCVHSSHHAPAERDCRRCYYSQTPALNDRFYNEAVKPYTWFAATLLFFSYIIGLLFTLRTHAATIWTEPDAQEKKILEMSASSLSQSGHVDFPHSSFVRQATGQSISRAHIRDSQLYKRMVSQTLQEVGLGPEQTAGDDRRPGSKSDSHTPHMVPPKDSDAHSHRSFHVEGLTDDAAQSLARQITEIAATTTALATRDVTRAPRKAAQLAHTPSKAHAERPVHTRTNTEAAPEELDTATGHASGGHDAPNWSRQKSAAILLSATVAYAIIAEILVNTVDGVLEGSDIDEKFLGITLFALVPNTTEFLNAISFAMNGNIALSMEIGFAYALQVCLLQIPALVFYSAIHSGYIPAQDVASQTFTLIFPQWDMVTVILCVFLLSYMYGEGKSNYFKGSILILSYLVVIAGFYLSGFNDFQKMGVDPMDTLALGGLVEQQVQSMTFKTPGRGRSGVAY
jgi:Ca2+:H+ antiporter